MTDPAPSAPAPFPFRAPEVPPVERNQVRVFRCESWSEFTSAVRRDKPMKVPEGIKVASRTIYRGHSNADWKLSSQLERRLTTTWVEADGTPFKQHLRQYHGLPWYESLCSSILESFKFFAHGRLGYDRAATDDEIWALGRHSGLVTPLLDWTLSPYVAAFFAFEDVHKGLEHLTQRPMVILPDVAVHVWGLRFWEPELEVSGEFEVVDARPLTAERQGAQSGVFTRLRSVDHIDVESYLISRGLGHCLERYEISRNAGVPALHDLQAMNIHPATLFPDLQGAAQQANLSKSTLSHGNWSVEQMFPKSF